MAVRVLIGSLLLLLVLEAGHGDAVDDVALQSRR
jgi:hypothetical protein